MSRSITCTNNQGVTMTFNTEGFSPFVLAYTDGLYQSVNNVFTSDNTMTDGSTFQGIVAKKRNITLALMDKPENVYNQANRDLLYVLFSKDSTGTLTYTENGNTRQISYKVEKVYKGKLKSRLITVSLICTDPFFYDEENTRIMLADWVGDFEFAHEFSSDGEEIGHREQTRIATIKNDISVNNLGMTIIIEAFSTVLNPKITRIEDATHLQIGSEDYPFTMVSGDVITITTTTGNKHVKLLRDGVETEINEYLTEDSKFLQIQRGLNHYGYSADDGDEYLILTFLYKGKYEGA